MIQTFPPQLWPFRELVVGLAHVWVEGGSDAVLLVNGQEVVCLAGDEHSSAERYATALDLPGAEWVFEIRGGPQHTADRVRLAASLLSRLARREREVDRTAAALIDANDQLLSLYDLAASRTSTLSRRELLDGLAADALRITGSSAAVLVCGRGMRSECGNAAMLEVLVALLPEYEHDHRSVIVLRADEHDLPADVVLRWAEGADVGLLALAARPGERFGTPQLKLVEAVCAHITDRVELATMHEQEVARAVIERDVATASALAAQALPKRLPVIPGLELRARCDPARLASGDYYVVVEFDDRLVFAIGDVSGKGLPAALVMTMVSSATKAAALRVRSTEPDALLRAINTDVFEYLDDTGIFVTTAVGTWHIGSDTLRIANAGHSPVLVVAAARHGQQPSVQTVRPSMPPLGVLPQPTPAVVDVPFLPGDLLVFGTDGLAEQLDAHGNQLGYDTLSTMLVDSVAAPIDDVIGRLFARVESHGAGASQDDDRTALILRRPFAEQQEVAA